MGDSQRYIETDPHSLLAEKFLVETKNKRKGSNKATKGFEIAFIASMVRMLFS
jgi:hypothetical protein